MSEKAKAQKYEDALREAFEYDEGALEANAKGRLTKMQAARLASGIRARAVALLIFVAIGVLVVILGRGMLRAPIGIVLYLVLVLGSIYMSATALREWAKGVADARRGGIDSVEGRVQLDVGANPRKKGELSMTVGDQTFFIRKEMFLALKNGDPYRVYYLRRTRMIASVEWLLSGMARDAFVEEAHVPDEREAPEISSYDSRAARSKR